MKRRLGLAVIACLLGTSLPAHAAEAWAPTLPMRPQTRQHLDLFPDGTAYAFSAEDNVLYASTDFGSTWAPRTTAPGQYASVAFGTPDLGYAAGFGGDFLTTHDGARTWQPQRGPLGPNAFATFNTVEVAAAGRVVVVGGTPQPGPGCPPPSEGFVAVWYSANGGRTWRERRLPFFGTVRAINMLDARTGVALIYDRFTRQQSGTECSYGSSSNSVWLTRDGFRTMRRVYDCSGYETCTAVTLAGPSRILVGTNNADLYVSGNGGRSFRRIGRFSGTYDAAAEPYFWIGGIAFANPRVGYLSTKGGGTWRTTDGGATWQQERSTEQAWGLGIGDIAVADPDHAIAGGPNFVITRVAV